MVNSGPPFSSVSAAAVLARNMALAAADNNATEAIERRFGQLIGPTLTSKLSEWIFDSDQSIPYLLAVCLVLVTLLCWQLSAFSKPPPVPLKKLPSRPVLNIMFMPDENSAGNETDAQEQAAARKRKAAATPTTTTTSSVSSFLFENAASSGPWKSRISKSMSSVFRAASDDVTLDEPQKAATPKAKSCRVETVDDDDPSDTMNDNQSTASSTTMGGPGISKPFAISASDLPDSFAPLLSSSQTSVLWDNVPADLLHACQAQATLTMAPGLHEVPLNKDASRPQLQFHVKNDSEQAEAGSAPTKHRLTAVATVGSDNLDLTEDLNPVSKPSHERSMPIVKEARIVLDPPLPLRNVAPTLIHFPTLFEDYMLRSTLQSMPFVRWIVNCFLRFTGWLERCLWILESKCQIHLGRISLTPVYKGMSKAKPSTSAGANADVEPLPDWRLSLSFSGHVLLFGWLPIPFIGVQLPTFIIPQPHALLRKLATRQPLASAKLRRDKMPKEQRIALALLQTAETWNTHVKLVATPPAVGVNVTLAGGVAVSMECGLGRDPEKSSDGGSPLDASEQDNNSMSSWTTVQSAFRPTPNPPSGAPASAEPEYDANTVIPWSVEFKAKGQLTHEKLSVYIVKLQAQQWTSEAASAVSKGLPPQLSSQFAARGSVAIWKPLLLPSGAAVAAARGGGGSVDGTSLTSSLGEDNISPTSPQFRRTAGGANAGSAPPSRTSTTAGTTSIPTATKPSSFGVHLRTDSFGRFALDAGDTPSVAAVLLFPDEVACFHREMRVLQYDYCFDVSNETQINAVTVSVGASHPMLNGGTMVTTILERLYAFGSLAARETQSILDPIERKRKRDILRHLPAVDLTLGVNNVFIPAESKSFSDDGQTLFVPAVQDGRCMVRLLGGVDDATNLEHKPAAAGGSGETVYEGIKLVANFEVPSLGLQTEGNVKEFPELDIFQGSKSRTLLQGMVGGTICAHLRPQPQHAAALMNDNTGPNVLNPLEAYEIAFSGSALNLKMKEYKATLGHRRIIFPTESTIGVKIVQSIVDMQFEGKTECELSWDFQGLSPILQVTAPGNSPAHAGPENKEQVSLLIPPLRQGRFLLNVSPVGGIHITKASTSREDKEGLYDWKFFNALVSPDNESPKRVMDVLHDKRTMDKCLQIIKLINADLYKILKYGLNQVLRFKEILDKEGVSDPKHAIPTHRMARLVSLIITGSADHVDDVLPIVKRAVEGDGLDIVKVKDLLRQHVTQYDDWAPEMDRLVRWAAVAFGPMPTDTAPYVEENVIPLAEVPQYASKFRNIPSASHLYESIREKPNLPLDTSVSNLVSRVAPYLTFAQIQYILEARHFHDWQPHDLRRLRYVYSIKRKVLEIAESYGGLSFLPQSFLVSVFLGEATKSSMRAASVYASKKQQSRGIAMRAPQQMANRVPYGSTGLRRRYRSNRSGSLDTFTSPAERVAPRTDFDAQIRPQAQQDDYFLGDYEANGMTTTAADDTYELGDSLLGPQDVATLLQAGLTSVLKSSTVVQLNQRMLLDLICSQPRGFAVAVLAEIGGHGSARGLTSALMSLLELDQSAFKPHHQIDMHHLLEEWLPGLSIPRREDYMAGGRWARQSYYEAVFNVASSIYEDAEVYFALKNHLQRARQHTEQDPIPQPRQEVGLDEDSSMAMSSDVAEEHSGGSMSRLKAAIHTAQGLIAQADTAGMEAMALAGSPGYKQTHEYASVVRLYHESFEACAKVLSLDKHAFHATWFANFYKRNYDALMILSMYDNLINDVDKSRHWLQALRSGAMKQEKQPKKGEAKSKSVVGTLHEHLSAVTVEDTLFLHPENSSEQVLIDAILDATIFEVEDRERLRKDPLVRLLIANPEGNYDFAIVTAMGVITDGKRGKELANAFDRLQAERGVKTIRADTGTARSFEYNAGKIEEAIEEANALGTPFGFIGYSQGCANALMAETTLLTGSPKQRERITGGSSSRGNSGSPNKRRGGLVCRQLLFSAANGSCHGPCMEKKIQRLTVMCEEFFKYQQGYFSSALSSAVLEIVNDLFDSSAFHKIMGGAQSFLPDGCRAFWREAQHMSHVPTCTLKGVLETHTTPECLEMLSHLLEKQSGSPLHDSQVHVFDAVGYPVYYHNRNGRVLKKCAIGEGAIQRTHHWSPLSEEVEWVQTQKDLEIASFDCAKDRHVFPWVHVNARFGFIKYAPKEDSSQAAPRRDEAHPSKLIASSSAPDAEKKSDPES